MSGKAMNAYKFRKSEELPYALDIIFNRRLYCADWQTLNDPMEGAFAYSYGSTDERDHSETIAEIIRHKKRLRVCSLSLTFDCHLLWAHYASGFAGLAVEVELPDDPIVVRRVQYGGVFRHMSLGRDLNPLQAAEEILSSKYREWEYEMEARILHHEEWYVLQKPVKRVIAGHRMNPSVFEALHIICTEKDIPFARTGIGDEGIDADYVPPLQKKRNGRSPGKPP